MGEMWERMWENFPHFPHIFPTFRESESPTFLPHFPHSGKIETVWPPPVFIHSWVLAGSPSFRFLESFLDNRYSVRSIPAPPSRLHFTICYDDSNYSMTAEVRPFGPGLDLRTKECGIHFCGRGHPSALFTGSKDFLTFFLGPDTQYLPFGMNIPFMPFLRSGF